MREPSGYPPLVSEEGIRGILSDGERLAIVTQPIVDLRRGVIVGYEALARFKLEKPAPPDVVFACAERAGLGEELEAFVVKRALPLAKDTPPNCFLAINVDPQHLTSTRVMDVILDHGNLGGIVFELTEQRQIDDVREVARSLSRLRKLGAISAVDDAGAGYSGLQQILALRPQFLKLDRTLVSSVNTDEAKRATIEMLGELAERLDAWIIAEGVESGAELHVLAQLGVPLAQGYFLAHPTAPWAGLTPEVERALDALPRDTPSTGLVEALVEPCALCDLESEWPDDSGTCVRLESTTRPVEMRIADESGVRLRSSHEFLRVKRGSPLASVALRSAARLERLRWDPIVCIDDLGHFEGLIHVHKLVWALASRDSSKPQHAERSYESDVSELVAKRR
ncbi:MAG TPA: EAL domain-containing protein [Polyangiales bacterium]|nr:EAL domain-containing protein [Polyangiales bacterium]